MAEERAQAGLHHENVHDLPRDPEVSRLSRTAIRVVRDTASCMLRVPRK